MSVGRKKQSVRALNAKREASRSEASKRKKAANRKKQTNPPVGSAAHEARMERQRARRAFDKKHGKSARKGKDISHKKGLKNGGSNKDGTFLESPSKNRSRNYKK